MKLGMESSGPSNIGFLLGKANVFLVPSRDGEVRRALRKKLVESGSGQTHILGMEVDRKVELVAWLLRFFHIRHGSLGKSVARFLEEMSAEGYQVVAMWAAMPDLRSARFCFPVEDCDSHKYLIERILASRRYALGWRTRILFGIYRRAIGRLCGSYFLFPAIYIKVERL